MAKKNKKKKFRNPYVVSARSRIAGTMKDRREGRGGAKNIQSDFLREDF